MSTDVTAPKPGDLFDLDGRTVEVIVVNRRERTVCGLVPATLDDFGNADRVHDIPWATVWGQAWACDYTEGGDDESRPPLAEAGPEEGLEHSVRSMADTSSIARQVE